VLEEYPGKVRLVIKHYPYRYRDYSQLAAEAAEAASAQGKFWPMHDLMLEQKRLNRESLIGYAEMLDLDVGRFTRELDSGKYRSRVEQDVELALKLGLYQTPTFIINGRKLVGDRPIEKFYELIDAALREAEEK
jgi:protein-disulfide isomerase